MMSPATFLPLFLTCFALCLLPIDAESRDYNQEILRAIGKMPRGGTYARYRKDAPESQRLDDLHKAVRQLDNAIGVGLGGKLKVAPAKASGYSFCSSATYLLFAELIEDLQRQGVVSSRSQLSRELAGVGGEREVIQGKLDGIGIFGHWNADGPGTAVLFHRLGLGANFSDFADAKPGDFLKIFWNGWIGKGERGHLVVYLGDSAGGDSIRVWSSNLSNSGGGGGYGEMAVAKSRIKRAVFSRLEKPENLIRWLDFSEAQKRSDYLIDIRRAGVTTLDPALTGVRYRHSPLR